jgi:hypothetical protein
MQNNQVKVNKARCDAYGDMPDGQHVMDIENENLNISELRIKHAALIEAHEDSSEVHAELVRRICALPSRPRGSDYAAGMQLQQARGR